MKNVSYWLVPAEPMRTDIQKLVERLATQFDAVPFEPHVTIYSGKSDENEVRRNVEIVVNRFRPMPLVARSLEFSPVLRKTLFMQFEPSSALQSISDTIKENSRDPADYQLDPHMSFLYQFLPDTVLSKLAEEIALPKGRYDFDTVQVIELDGPTTTVEFCQTLETRVPCHADPSMTLSWQG